MMRLHVAAIVCAFLLPAVAFGQESAPDSAATEAAAVLAELSQQSGLPQSELSELLRNCDASQTSLNLCAQRDQVAAERALRRIMADKEQALPKCKAWIESKVAMWRRSRDSGCETSAARDYGDGSMKPMVQAMCMQAETVKMTNRVKRLKHCR
jgi:hypothetical protein